MRNVQSMTYFFGFLTIILQEFLLYCKYRFRKKCPFKGGGTLTAPGDKAAGGAERKGDFMESTKKALIFQGGWDGHEPALVAGRFKKMLEKHGYACEVYDSQDVLADAERLMGTDLIVPCWTMG